MRKKTGNCGIELAPVVQRRVHENAFLSSAFYRWKPWLKALLPVGLLWVVLGADLRATMPVQPLVSCNVASSLSVANAGSYSPIYNNFGMTDLLTGNPGTIPVNLRSVIKWDLTPVRPSANPALFQRVSSAKLRLDCTYSNPYPATTAHWFVLEAYTTENSGAVSFNDVTTESVVRVGAVRAYPLGSTCEIDVTDAVLNAIARDWGHVSFRIVETDEAGNYLTLGEVQVGCVFSNPVLNVISSDLSVCPRLENDRVMLFLDPAYLTLIDVIDRNTGISYVTEPGWPLFDVSLREKNSWIYGYADLSGAASRSISYNTGIDGTQTATLSFVDCPVPDLAAGTKIDATVTLRLPAGEKLYRFSSVLTPKGTAASTYMWNYLNFPNLRGLGSRAAAASANEFVIVPEYSGKRTASPRTSGGSFGWEFPGTNGISMCSYHDGAGGGLYFDTRDVTGYRKNTHCTAMPGNRSFSMDVLHVPDAAADANGVWRSPYEVTFGPLLGDWYDAAKIYRKWAISQSKWKTPVKERTNIPQWFKELNVWFQGDSNGNWDQLADRLISLKARLNGEPFGFHWYLWQKGNTHDVGYPDYFPAYGGPTEFPDAVAKLKANGVRVMPYVSSCAFDTSIPMWTTESGSSSVILDIGLLPQSALTAPNLVQMCPQTSYWFNKMSYVAANLGVSGTYNYGVDAIYLDQLHCAPFLCFSKSHGHAAEGGSWYAASQRRIVEEARTKCGPDAAVTGEHFSDFYSDLVSGQLAWADIDYKETPQFEAAMNDRTILFGLPLFRGSGYDETANLTTFVAKQSYAFVRGRQLGWFMLGYGDFTDPGNFVDQVACLNKLIACRTAIRDFVAYGEFLRPPALVGATKHTVSWVRQLWQNPENIEVPDVMTGAYLSSSGHEIAMILANTTNAPITATLPINTKDWGVTVGSNRVRTDWNPNTATWNQAQSIVLGSTIQSIPIPAYSSTVIKLSNVNRTNIGIKSWANDVMSGYDNGSYVVNGTQSDPFVGNINNLPGKTRMLLKFDISNISGTVTAADLDLTSFYRAGTNVVQVSSYNSNETSATFTSADIADSLANSTPITTFTDTSGPDPQLHWNLDITSAVQTAKANGYSYISFLLYSETANAITEAPFDSHVFFLAKNGGNGVYDPNITVTATAIPVPPTFAEWASTKAGGQVADLDWDNDGVTNGVEYFMNAATGFTSNPGLIGLKKVTWTNGGNIPSSAYGTKFVVQTSTDLEIWEDVSEENLDENTDGPGGSLSYTVTGSDKQFVRLKVTPN